ncbi:MAG: phosphoglycerate dehydrogenase-like enzyme, partial [Limisphaerales bacterium]
MRVLFQYQPKEEVVAYIKSKVHPDTKLAFGDSGNLNQLLSLAGEAEVLVGWSMPEGLLSKLSKLKVFINPGAGINRLTIDLDGRIPPFPIVNSHDNTVLTAQHAVSLLLAVSSQVVVHHELMRSGAWRSRDPEGISTPLIGSNIGILGYGSVGSRIHELLNPFNANFHLLKTKWDIPPTDATSYTTSELNKFLKAIDQLIITLPLTPETVNLIGLEEIKLLGKNGVLINVGRGEIINEEALYIALKEKYIKGAGIDVWYNYKPKEDQEGNKFPYSFPFNR